MTKRYKLVGTWNQLNIKNSHREVLFVIIIQEVIRHYYGYY